MTDVIPPVLKGTARCLERLGRLNAGLPMHQTPTATTRSLSTWKKTYTAYEWQQHTTQLGQYVLSGMIDLTTINHAEYKAIRPCISALNNKFNRTP